LNRLELHGDVLGTQDPARQLALVDELRAAQTTDESAPILFPPPLAARDTAAARAIAPHLDGHPTTH
jgi:hypothetical protein